MTAVGNLPLVEIWQADCRVFDMAAQLRCIFCERRSVLKKTVTLIAPIISLFFSPFPVSQRGQSKPFRDNFQVRSGIGREERQLIDDPSHLVYCTLEAGGEASER